MEDKSLMKKFAVGACIACCAVNLAIIFGAGTFLTGFAVLVQSPVAIIFLGFAFIGMASFLIWKRNRKAACCDVAKA